METRGFCQQDVDIIEQYVLGQYPEDDFANHFAGRSKSSLDSKVSRVRKSLGLTRGYSSENKVDSVKHFTNQISFLAIIQQALDEAFAKPENQIPIAKRIRIIRDAKQILKEKVQKLFTKGKI